MGDVQACETAREFDVSVQHVAAGAVISVSGELDLASRDGFVAACRSGGATSLVIDMAALVFMDCRGWGGVIEAECHVRSATIRGATGQPARLIDLIRTLELRQ